MVGDGLSSDDLGAGICSCVARLRGLAAGVRASSENTGWVGDMKRNGGRRLEVFWSGMLDELIGECFSFTGFCFFRGEFRRASLAGGGVGWGLRRGFLLVRKVRWSWAGMVVPSGLQDGDLCYGWRRNARRPW